MALGIRIRQLRQVRGLTQAQLGGSDLSKSFISLLEKDRTRPSVETLLLIAQRLNTSVDSLLGQESHIHELIATGVLTMTSQLIRSRDYARASTMLSFVDFLATTYGIEEAQREAQLQAAKVALDQGALPQAWAQLEIAQQASERAKDLWRSGRVFLLMGWVQIRQREFPAAADLFERALAILRRARAGRDPARVEALIGLGNALTRLDKCPAAIRRYEEAVHSEVAAHDAVLRGQAWWGMGAAQRRLGDFEGARESFLKAKDALESAEELADMMRVLHNLGQLFFQEGRPKEALRYLHQALRVMERLEKHTDRAAMLTEIARVHMSLGNLADAEQFVRQALELAQKVGDAVEIAEAQIILARLYSFKKDDLAAIACLKEAVSTFQARGMRLKMAEAARELGLLLRAHGAHAEAVDYLALAVAARGEHASEPVARVEP